MDGSNASNSNKQRSSYGQRGRSRKGGDGDFCGGGGGGYRYRDTEGGKNWNKGGKSNKELQDHIDSETNREFESKTKTNPKVNQNQNQSKAQAQRHPKPKTSKRFENSAANQKDSKPNEITSDIDSVLRQLRQVKEAEHKANKAKAVEPEVTIPKITILKRPNRPESKSQPSIKKTIAPVAISTEQINILEKFQGQPKYNNHRSQSNAKANQNQNPRSSETERRENITQGQGQSKHNNRRSQHDNQNFKTAENGVKEQGQIKPNNRSQVNPTLKATENIEKVHRKHNHGSQVNTNSKRTEKEVAQAQDQPKHNHMSKVNTNQLHIPQKLDPVEFQGRPKHNRRPQFNSKKITTENGEKVPDKPNHNHNHRSQVNTNLKAAEKVEKVHGQPKPKHNPRSHVNQHSRTTEKVEKVQSQVQPKPKHIQKSEVEVNPNIKISNEKTSLEKVEEQHKATDSKEPSKVKNKKLDKGHKLSKQEKRKKPKKISLTKVCVRLLPPKLTKEDLINEVGPLAPHNYFFLKNGDDEDSHYDITTIWVNFLRGKDARRFIRRVKNRLFYDAETGIEYYALTEYAIDQHLPKILRRKNKKRGTLEKSAHYQEFLKSLEEDTPDKYKGPSPSEMTAEIEQKHRDMQDARAPLVSYLLDNY